MGTCCTVVGMTMSHCEAENMSVARSKRLVEAEGSLCQCTCNEGMGTLLVNLRLEETFYFIGHHAFEIVYQPATRFD